VTLIRGKKIAFVGAGRMAEALIKGLNSSGICASDVSSRRLKLLKSRYRIKTFKNNIDCIKRADVIVLAVKPKTMGSVLREIGPSVRPGHLVISIAAGVPTYSIRKYIRKAGIVRSMPNNPALVGAGVTAISSKNRIAEAIFSSVGEVVVIPEKLMDAVTALSGSGPAFIYLAAQALEEGGRAAGLSRKAARKLAIETVFGAGKTMKLSGKDPAELADMVASPGGTTRAGMKVLSRLGFKKAVKSAIMAAAGRSKELGRELKP